jgi:tetratricopeptide (TPR) repeat protein
MYDLPMKTILVVVCFAVLFSAAHAQRCAMSAKEVKPELSEETRKKYEANLAVAFEENARAKNSADTMIWLGRRIAYLGNYKDAIRTFTAAISNYPNDARLYRHRGHRFITLRCFDDAIVDLRKAATLVKGKPDEVEPDGIPNAKNIPTSTLQSNIWYHLGLAYYLKHDFKNALKAYEEAEKVSKTADMLVATKHWQYMTLRRLGKKDEANRSVEPIAADLEIIENGDYYSLVKLYKGVESGEKLLQQFDSQPDNVSKASLGYGLGNRYLYHNMKADANKIFRQIVSGKQWASFGYIAAETEIK